jgi:hypothetical protein
MFCWEKSRNPYRAVFRMPGSRSAGTVLGPSGDAFTEDQLRSYLYRVHRLEDLMGEEGTYDSPEWIASCDYDIETGAGGNITQLVLFPICQAESRGMEDMRLVRFTDDDGSMRYYGTYTAYDGLRIRPQMFECPGLWRELRPAPIRTEQVPSVAGSTGDT